MSILWVGLLNQDGTDLETRVTNMEAKLALIGAILQDGQVPAPTPDPDPAPDPNAWTPAVISEKIWMDFYAEDAALGTVGTLTSRQGGITLNQPDGSKHPVRTADETLDMSGGKSLVIPHQSRGYITHRGILHLFRPSQPTGVDGSFIYLNGLDTGAFSRQGWIGHNAGQLEAQWRTPTEFNQLVLGTPAWGTWQCVLTRRDGGTHKASINGGTEFTTGTSVYLGRNNVNAEGLLGDFRSPAVDWEWDCSIVLSDELTQVEVDKLVGWACHKRGIPLPAGHPYETAPPLKGPEDDPPPYAETSATDYLPIQTSIKDPAIWRTTELTPIDLTGYTQEYVDDFTALNLDVEVGGTGPWYGGDISFGFETLARNAPISDTDVYSQAGSELIIKTLPDASHSTGWKSGFIQSVNLNGAGNTWQLGSDPSAGLYFEGRFRATGDGDKLWVAFWLKSVNEYLKHSQSRVEIDIIESYSVDPAGHHYTYHDHAALRPIPGRLASDRFANTGSRSLDGATWGLASNVLFDNQYHKYAVRIDHTETRVYFDDLEVGRHVTPIEFKQPLFILFNPSRRPENGTIDGTAYEVGLDHIQVWRK